MNRLFQDNPVAMVLAGIAGFLLFCMLVIFVWSSLPLGSDVAADSEGADGAELNLPALAESPPLENYSVITQRPLFNETRLPVIEIDAAGDEVAEELPLADETELEVELSGVVITPTLRMATLKRSDGSKSLVAFEGRYLEGEFGSWQLSQVTPRTVTLTSGSGKELKLELQVHDERIEPPEPPEPPPETAVDAVTNAESSETAQQGDEPLSRAEEIRQRIAERREELRRQAEAEDQAGAANAEPSYEDAIRNMINRRPEPDKPSETENEQ